MTTKYDDYHPDDAPEPPQNTYLGRAVASSPDNGIRASAEETLQAPKSNKELEEELKVIRAQINLLREDVDILKQPKKSFSIGGTKKIKSVLEDIRK